MADQNESDDDEGQDDFYRVVNMGASMLDQWLDTEESRAVGSVVSDESGGHAGGRRVVDILRTHPDDLTPVDRAYMGKVTAAVRRELARRPDEAQAEERWRHSLMNWGHDPDLP